MYLCERIKENRQDVFIVREEIKKDKKVAEGKKRKSKDLEKEQGGT